MNLVHITASVLFTLGLCTRIAIENQNETKSGSSEGPLVDVTSNMDQDGGKAVSVGGAKYRCCCSLEEEGVSCVLANTRGKRAEGWLNFKSGCGGLLGDGHHSYTSELLPEESRKCLIPVDRLPEGFCATGRDPLTACRTCLPNYDTSKDCGECVLGFDPTAACKECLPGRDPEFDCQECLPDFVDVKGTCRPASELIDVTREFTEPKPDSTARQPKPSATYWTAGGDISYRCCCASGRRKSAGQWLNDDGVSCRMVDDSKKTTVGMMMSGCGSLQGLSDGTYHSWTSKHLPTPEDARACVVPLGELPDEILLGDFISMVERGSVTE